MITEDDVADDAERPSAEWVDTAEFGRRLRVRPTFVSAVAVLAAQLGGFLAADGLLLESEYDRTVWRYGSPEIADNFIRGIPFGFWVGLGLGVVLVVVVLRLRAAERLYVRLLRGLVGLIVFTACFAGSAVSLLLAALIAHAIPVARLDEQLHLWIWLEAAGRAWGIEAGLLFVLGLGVYWMRSAARLRETRDAQGPTSF